MKALAAAGLAAALTILPLAATAQVAPELSRPIVALTGVLKKNADALKLTEAQRADLDKWIATMPAKRKAIEDETVKLRAELRSAILDGKPQEEREALAKKIGGQETKLLMMRSMCTDHWRKLLTPAQFADLVKLAGAK